MAIFGWVVLMMVALAITFWGLGLLFVLIMYDREEFYEWVLAIAVTIIGLVFGYIMLGNIPFTIALN